MPATRSLTLNAMALCVVTAHLSFAQQSDSARCHALIASATKDSVVVRIGMTVASLDTISVISANYRSLFVQAVRQELKLPRPLPIDVYGIVSNTDDKGKILGDGTVAPIVIAYYRATIRRDGHITNARVVGGARTKAFDDAVLAAIRAVGDSQTAPPFAEDIKGDAMEVRISIRNTGAIAANWTPLFAMRVPSFGLPSAMVKPDSGNKPPRFPRAASAAHRDGQMTVEFIVSPQGKADLGSVQVDTKSPINFVDAMLEALPDYRFKPLAISGCPVASVAQMPFIFNLAK
jgi:TonB family protein